MQVIAPCRTQVSDRFPIASFDIALPRSRYYEVACATDPRLFHSEWQRHRTPGNFFSSRAGGLLHAPGGRTAWFLPPQQLKRFAGAQRIYYALASYGNPSGAEAEFSISPNALDQVPSIALAADFTGRTLDRARLSGHVPSAEHYGSPTGATLRWGGDDALAAARQTPARASDEYDDGHSPELWRSSKRAPYAGGYAAEESSDVSAAEQAAYDAGIAYQQRHAQAAGLSAEEGGSEDECFDDEDDDVAFGSVRARAYGSADDEDDMEEYDRGIALGAADDNDGEYDAEDEDGYEDAAALYGAVGFDASGGVAVEEAPVGHTRAIVGEGRDPAYSENWEEEELLPAGSAVRALNAVPLEIAEKVRILRVVGLAESGADGYSAINPDNEYNDPKHPAYQKYHIGLSWGLIQFTQRSGSLGKVLKAVVKREAKLQPNLPAEHTFAQLFGPHSDELLRVTNDSDPDGRVASVGGANLWEPVWTARFRAAGQVPHVMWSQNEVAITEYFDPVLRVASWLGFDTPRALAMLVDRCIHMGKGGGLAWVLRTVGPVQSEGDRASALSALGFADLRAFQTGCAPYLAVDGRWGPMSHAAMTAALRNLGANSPLPVADRDTMLERMVDAARTTRFHKRLKALHENSTDFSDAVSFVLV